MVKVSKFNISKPKKYLDKQGQERTQWNQIGKMTVFQKDDGTVSRIMEIPAIGLEANIFPFEPKKTDGSTPQRVSQAVQAPADESEYQNSGSDDVKVEDIPF